MTIGDRIKKIRTDKNIKQGELANKIKCSKQTLYKYENNIVTNIPYEKIISLSEALDVTPSALMGWEDIKQTTNQIREATPSLAKATKLYMKLKNDEEAIALLETYYQLDEEKRKTAINLLNALK